LRINHRLSGLVFAFAVGLSVAYCSYQWISNPDRGARRAVEEGIVRESRRILHSYLAGESSIEISDALHRVKSAGKVYIYPAADGWELSGQYRRGGERAWHAYLMFLDRDGKLVTLSVEDSAPALLERGASEPQLEVSPPN